MFQVPTKLYPWVLLIVLQFMMPNISFLGHLSGILTGGLYAAGWLQWCIPAQDAVHAWEGNSSWLASLRRKPNYVACPAESVRLGSQLVQGQGGVLRQGAQLAYTVVRPALDCARSCWRGGPQGATAQQTTAPRRYVDDRGRLSNVTAPRQEGASGAPTSAVAPQHPSQEGTQTSPPSLVRAKGRGLHIIHGTGAGTDSITFAYR